jgi:hypothetical protein
MAVCAIRNYMNTANQIFEDRISADNINEAIAVFEDFCMHRIPGKFNERKHLGERTRVIYEKLKLLRSMVSNQSN